MIADSESYSGNSNAMVDTILQNRSFFVAYNIARLRELIRYLSEKKMEMFSTIPLLLHVNAPEWPGYVDHDQVPCGIYGFFDSGFWKLAKERLGVDHKDIRSFVGRAFFIKGVYVMGSAGSLGQNEHSDFDYWVVVDEKKMGPTERGFLRKKLRLIEQWARQQFDHHVTFFVLDSQQVRNNDFSGIAEEGFRITQKTILKEEFYRTFILIAGQVPYWAVLPTGLTAEEYGNWIDTAPKLSGDGFHSDDYVDLGHLSSIANWECLGSVLWQFCKAQDDPVKALIKASLIVHHVLFQKEDGLLCDVTKRRMADSQLDSYMLDPYAFVFERILSFYRKTEDGDGLDLIKTCIYLRITGYPTPSHPHRDNPKKWLLERYLREWSWGEVKLNRLLSYPSWPEQEKLRFESKILEKLWFLYKMLLRMDQTIELETKAYSEDLKALKNKASSQLKKKDGKLSWASNYLRLQQGAYPLYIFYKDNAWAVCDGKVKGSLVHSKPVFSAPELLHVLGWMVLNGLYNGDSKSFSFVNVPSPVPLKRAKHLLNAVYEHFAGNLDTSRFREAEPVCRRAFVAFDTSRYPNGDMLPSIDILVQNTWGEYFFRVLDLRQIKNKLLKYNEISKLVREYLPKNNVEGFYRLVDLRTVEDLSAEEEIFNTATNMVEKSEEKEGENHPVAIGEEHGNLGDGVILDLY